MEQKYLQQLPPSLRYLGDREKGEIEIRNASDDDPENGVLYEDKYILLVRDPVIFPGGAKGTYVRVIHRSELEGKGGTVIIPRWEEKIVFLKIFRHATRSWEWELPRGFQESGISEEENVRRELMEEIHVGSVSTRKIGSVTPNSGLTSNRASVYLADLEGSPLAMGRAQSAEGISEMVEVPELQLREFLSGNVTCGISLAAMMFYQIRGGRE